MCCRFYIINAKVTKTSRKTAIREKVFEVLCFGLFVLSHVGVAEVMGLTARSSLGGHPLGSGHEQSTEQF